MKAFLLIVTLIILTSWSAFAEINVDVENDCLDTYIRMSSQNYQYDLTGNQYISNVGQEALKEYSKRNSGDEPITMSTSKNSGTNDYVVAKIKFCDDDEPGQANCETYYYERKTQAAGPLLLFIPVLKTIYKDPHCCGPVSVTCVE